MSNLNIRMDDDIKNEANAILNELGLNATTAVLMFYKEIIRTKSLPFQPKINKDELYDELLILTENLPIERLPVNESGKIYDDGTLGADTRDWLVNG